MKLGRSFWDFNERHVGNFLCSSFQFLVEVNDTWILVKVDPRGICLISRDSDVIGAGSPVNRASDIEAPVLLFHGDRDINVPVDHSKKMANALKRKKKSVEYIEYEDVEHSIRRNAYRIDMLDRIGSFLDANIGQPATAP